MSSHSDAAPALDVARERVVRLLTDRYADDTLTVEQFEAELDRLHGLGEVAALERMAAELTTAARPAVARTAPPYTASHAGLDAASSALPSALGWQRGALVPARVAGEGRVVAVMSSAKRAGAWPVPRTLRVLAVMSEAVVDLRDAVLPAEGCEVEVRALMANVKVLLPPAVEAYVDVTALMGAVHDYTHNTPNPGHAPRVRVTGACVMSEVTAL